MSLINAIPEEQIYYTESGKSGYHRQDSRGNWIKVNESSAKNHLCSRGFSSKRVDDGLSEVDQKILDIQDHNTVQYVGPVAGHAAGLHTMENNQVLVDRGPQPVTSSPGEWPILFALLQMFSFDALRQLDYLYGWLKEAITAIYNSQWRASQMLAITGPAGCGKSLFQKLITIILGGRSAQPYQFMTGGTTFNSDLMAAEHLMIEDQNESIRIERRRHFASRLKEVTVNPVQRCHPKGYPALQLTPIFRMTCTLNDEPERLMVIPPLDNDVKDKIIILKAAKQAMPMPTNTLTERQAFEATLRAELPHFVHHLQNWEIPEDLWDERYGIKAFHHPDVVEVLQESTPEFQLLRLVDQAVFRLDDVENWLQLDACNGSHCQGPLLVAPFQGTALELKRRLITTESTMAEANKLLTHTNSCGNYLGRLASNADMAARVIKGTERNGYRQWTINPPAIYETAEQRWRDIRNERDARRGEPVSECPEYHTHDTALT